MAKAKIPILITCEAAALVPLAEFKEFQGKLKSLERARYEKLRDSIIKDGFHTSIDVWKKPGEKKPRRMLDGHQRVRTLRTMIEKENFVLEGGALPVDWIIAKTEKQANRIILEKLSQYGKTDEEKLYEFMHERKLDWEEVRMLADFPAINMGSFHVSYYGEPATGDDTVTPKDEDAMDGAFKCPKCGFKWTGKKAGASNDDKDFK